MQCHSPSVSIPYHPLNIDRIKTRAVRLIKEVVHTRKWLGVLTCNLIEASVVNVLLQRAIRFTHKTKWRAEFAVCDRDELSQPPLRLSAVDWV
jgi:hypothetical protein